MPTSAEQRILFITSNSIGDAILSTGLLSHLVATYPEARFTIACGPAPAALFRAVPRLEHPIVMRKQSWKRHWLTLWQQTAGTHWELIVDLRNSLLSRLLRARRRVRRVRARGRHKLLDHAATLRLATPPAPKIWLDASAMAAADQLLAMAAGRPILALGTSANWFPKQWPIAHFTELATRLTATDGPLPNGCVLIAAAEHERAQVAPLVAALPAGDVINAIGHDLLTVAACLRHCHLFVGNDSGLMHLAAAMGAPTLGLFGPGYEKIYAPWGERCAVVRTPESDAELRQRLTTPDAPNLMETLTVDTVEQAAAALLARGGTP